MIRYRPAALDTRQRDLFDRVEADGASRIASVTAAATTAIGMASSNRRT